MTKPRPLPPKAKKVLSIQSHVVHGYVGNKAATFPLQTLNWDVDVLNSVNFSNHTGYGSWEGVSYSAEELGNLFEGLRNIDMKYDAILTGYIHGAGTLKAAGEECLRIKKQAPSTMWVLDPVMGDEGQMYVSEDVIPVYRELLLQKGCDIITPNQFELELLLKTKIDGVGTLREACRRVHKEYGVKHLVISSLTLTCEQLGLPDSNAIICCVSSVTQPGLVLFEIPRMDSYFTGVGDLFSALLLDRMYRSGESIVVSTNQVLTVMKKVLEITRGLCIEQLGSDVQAKIGDFHTMKQCELPIVECMDIYGQREEHFKPVAI